MNAELRAAHKSHLDDYWPIFMIACAVEAGGFIVLRDDEFTLLVCAKSIVLSCIWMGRDDKGVFVSLLFLLIVSFADHGCK